MGRSSRSSSSFLKQAFFGLLCVFGVLATAEASLRIIGYFQSRKPLLDKISHADDFIIVCIGDSFTFGICVDSKDTYPAQLERMLNGSGLGRHFRVFNFGVPGSNSSMHLKYFKELTRMQVRPDAVIVLSGANDSWNLANSNIAEIGQSQSAADRAMIKAVTFLADFRLYKMVRLILVNLTGRTPETGFGRDKIVKAEKSIPNSMTEKLKIYNLTQMALLARAEGIQLILQNYPSPCQGDCGTTPDEKVARVFSLPFVNNCRFFNARLGQMSLHDLYIYDNSHPNAAGYTMMAEQLCGVIKEAVVKGRK